MAGHEIATGQNMPKAEIQLKKMVYKSYIKKTYVKAKLFQKGDETGFLDPEKTVPFIRNFNGIKYIGRFDADYMVMLPEGTKLVPKDEFEKDFREFSI